MFVEKPLNPGGRRGKKTGKDQVREKSKIFWLAW